MDLPRLSTPSVSGPHADPRMATAREMEAAFLAEMLAHAGLGQSEGEFGGGAGADQFASFLRQEQARQIVAAGGIGLAEAIFATMVERDHG